MINPSNLVTIIFEESQLVNMLHHDKVCITDISSTISSGDLCVQDVNLHPLQINKHLLHFEPYAGIGQISGLLDSLFDPDKANTNIPKRVLFDYARSAHKAGATAYQISCMMSISSGEIQGVQASEQEKIFRLFLSGITNYKSLHELFDSYSIFHGRNPLVSGQTV